MEQAITQIAVIILSDNFTGFAEMRRADIMINFVYDMDKD